MCIRDSRFIAQGDGRINIIYRQCALLYAVGDDLLIPEQINSDADNDINKNQEKDKRPEIDIEGFAVLSDISVILSCCQIKNLRLFPKISPGRVPPGLFLQSRPASGWR